MFDIGWSELMVIAVVALVVVGPKELPQAIYSIGKWMRKARLVARDLQGHIDEMMREAELNELRKQALKVRDINVKQTVETQLDPKGELMNAFSVSIEMTDASGHPGSPPEDALTPPLTKAAKPAAPVTTDPVVVTPQPAATDKPA